jgi:hypothetical protein
MRAIRSASNADVTLPGLTPFQTMCRGSTAPFRFGLLDYGEGCTGGGAVAFDPLFRKLQKKGFGGRYTTRSAALADSNHPAQDRLIGGFTMTTPRTPRRIATPALGKTSHPWWLAIPDAIAVAIIRWIAR